MLRSRPGFYSGGYPSATITRDGFPFAIGRVFAPDLESSPGPKAYVIVTIRALSQSG